MTTTTKTIKCGGCKGQHDTKEQVRECCLGGAAIKAPTPDVTLRQPPS